MSTAGEDWLSAAPAVLVVSPHLDDAVLSAYALLSADLPLEVAVVFSGAPDVPRQTPWDRLCGFTDSDQAVAARRQENERALSGWSLTQHFLGLLDGQYLDGPRDSADAAALVRFVDDWSRLRGPGALVAVPAGAGRLAAPGGLLGAPRSARRQSIRRVVGPAGRVVLEARARFRAPRTPPFAHPDHVLVRDALASGAAVDPGSLVLYEDLPYSWGEPADERVQALARRLDRTPVPHTAPVDREAKARRVAEYGSQLRYMYAPHGPLSSAAGIPATERFWSLGR